MRIVSVIPARSGSKGLPDKNIAKVAGFSLIELAAKQAIESELIEDVYISTDSECYHDIAVKAGCQSVGLRHSALASDTSSSVDVIIDFCKKCQLGIKDLVVLLQPTSPVRTAKLIDQGISLAMSSGESVVSVSLLEEPHPAKLKRIENGNLVPFLKGTISEVPRQQLESLYMLTGAVYVTTVGNLQQNHSFFSRETKPLFHERFVNIDSRDDLEYLEYLLACEKVVI